MKKFFAIYLALLAFSIGLWYFLSQEKDIQTPIATVFYLCNEGKIIEAAYYKGSPITVAPGKRPVPSGSIQLKFDNSKPITLPQTISADGARYTNTDESFVFWGKGNGAMVLENNAEKNYTGCVQVSEKPAGSDLLQIYAEPSGNFSLRLPPGYKADPSYRDEIEPAKTIFGTSFTIPSSLSNGTNLSSDSFISIESLPETPNCTADLFLSHPSFAVEITENGTVYSIASSTDAGAGNRYEETVYAMSGTNPCTAVKYRIHYMAFENYAPGMVTEFDKISLLKEFDLIRKTLILR